MGLRVNRAELAEIAGVSLPTISKWVRDGCPVLTRGSKATEYQFDSAAVWKWREEQVRGREPAEHAGLTEQRTRLTRERADMAELERRQAAGELLPVADVEKAWTAMIAVARQRLLAIPAKMGPRTRCTSSDAQAVELLHDSICAALAELSTAKVVVRARPDDRKGGER